MRDIEQNPTTEQECEHKWIICSLGQGATYKGCVKCGVSSVWRDGEQMYPKPRKVSKV